MYITLLSHACVRVVLSARNRPQCGGVRARVIAAAFCLVRAEPRGSNCDIGIRSVHLNMRKNKEMKKNRSLRKKKKVLILKMGKVKLTSEGEEPPVLKVGS